jgi:hypothetical protein
VGGEGVQVEEVKVYRRAVGNEWGTDGGGI